MTETKAVGTAQPSNGALVLSHLTFSSAVVGVSLLASSLTANAGIIDTTGDWDGSRYVQQFGEPNTATYGQTITIGSQPSRLSSFTFFVNDFLNTDFVEFEGIVFAWDGAKATGPALFQSGPMTTTNNGGADGFEPIMISTGGIELAANTEYVLALTASNLFDGTDGTSRWGCTTSGCSGPSTYAGGTFVFLVNGSDFDELTSRNWGVRDGDLAFTAVFEAPVPGTGALLGLGLLSLLLRRPELS